uniref:hypothetical protein n=1 Tax=Bradyrhizobium sp. (strain ORS 278) TaxID=114615 RepID=UPI0012FED9A5|nr:hypothetical protein [Bradyrhizobium sp. ORS 278]
MTSKLSGGSAKAKSGRFPDGNRNCPKGNPISPVMQNVRGSLGAVKAAQELQFLTGEPLSICQKLLSGHRVENRDMLVALCQTRLVIDAVLGLIDPDVKDPTARAVRKAMRKLKLELELARLDREDAE